MATRFDSDSDIVNKTVAEARLNAEKHQFLFFAVQAEFDNDVLRVIRPPVTLFLMVILIKASEPFYRYRLLKIPQK